MENNLDLIKQIYIKIMYTQEEQIRAKTIKTEDLINSSEDEFVTGLQQDIAAIVGSDVALINKVCLRLLKRVEKIQDVGEVTKDSKLKLPQNWIKKFADEAVRAEDNSSREISASTKKSSNLRNANLAGLSTELLKIGTFGEMVAFYDSLGDDQKRKIREELADDIFGSGYGVLFTCYEDNNLNKENGLDIGTSEEIEEEERITNVITNVINEFLRSLGVEIKSPDDLGKMMVLFHQMKDINNLSNIISRLKNEKERAFLKKIGIDKDDKIKEFAEKAMEELKERKGLGVLDEFIDKNSNMIRDSYKRIVSFLNLQLGEETVTRLDYNDIRQIFLLAINGETGEINPRMALKSMKKLIKEKEITDFDDKRFYYAIKEMNVQQSEISKDKVDNGKSKDEGIVAKEEHSSFRNRNQQDNIQNKGEQVSEAPIMSAEMAKVFTDLFKAHQEMLATIQNPSIGIEDNGIEDKEIESMQEQAGVQIDTSLIDKKRREKEPLQDQGQGASTGENVFGKENIVVTGSIISIAAMMEYSKKYAKGTGMTSTTLHGLQGELVLARKEKPEADFDTRRDENE